MHVERIVGPAGTVTRMLNSGGGGWGDPLERDRQRVRYDLRDEYVSFEGAACDYGVVVVGDLTRPEDLVVDEEQTAKLRAELRAAR